MSSEYRYRICVYRAPGVSLQGELVGQRLELVFCLRVRRHGSQFSSVFCPNEGRSEVSSRCHEYITGWASWLILDRLPKNWKDALSGGSARSNLRWYNRLFTTYNDGWDKRVVFVCLILGPIAMLWAGVSAGWPLAAGQGLVVVQTLAAWGTARLAGRGINKRGGYMKSKLVAAAAEQQEGQSQHPYRVARRYASPPSPSGPISRPDRDPEAPPAH